MLSRLSESISARVLVTGGTGFVGTWMQRSQPKGLNVDYWGRADYEKFLPYISCKYIVHLAPVSPDRMIKVAMHQNARLLYASSGIVYHPENDCQYRNDKILWEAACLQSGVDVVIARLFTFYGAGLDDNQAYTQFAKAAKANKPIRIWGDGEAVRSYMHGMELGQLMWAILLKGKSGEIYEVGSPRPVTMLQACRSNHPNPGFRRGFLLRASNLPQRRSRPFILRPHPRVC